MEKKKRIHEEGNESSKLTKLRTVRESMVLAYTQVRLKINPRWGPNPHGTQRVGTNKMRGKTHEQRARSGTREPV